MPESDMSFAGLRPVTTTFDSRFFLISKSLCTAFITSCIVVGFEIPLLPTTVDHEALPFFPFLRFALKIAKFDPLPETPE